MSEAQTTVDTLPAARAVQVAVHRRMSGERRLRTLLSHLPEEDCVISKLEWPTLGASERQLGDV